MKEASEQLTEETARPLADEFQPEEIILFGSHAWGALHEDSDLDIMVIVRESQERPARRAARAYRSLRGLAVPADILVRTRSQFEEYRQAHASPEARVSEEGRTIYGGSQDKAGTRMARQGVPPTSASVRV
ncbi:MAG: nucleotidyltransferase domain-containing protein [Anaerolineae bacterium]|nr:nucleotidyltransferase domain-containing protein [Anaerolineae bacterium]